MTLKMTFLGSGSAFTIGPENYHSNILFQLGKDTLLLDAGSDIRHSLREQNLSYKDINNVYISHLHGDHTGGLEWLALTTHFDPNYKGKPNLFANEKVIIDLWNKTLSGGLSTLPHKHPSIDSFFNSKPIKKDGCFTWHSIEFKLIQTIHFYSEYELMPSYGLIFTYNKTRVLFTTDTQSTPEYLTPFYEEADIIFHDCETTPTKSTVHSHYSELRLLPAHIKKKMWLYHYNPGSLPDAKKDGFLGFVVKGQCFEF
ncbi:MBL fold metallo-hydrolase [Legionella maioricensis]|uniref:MBL fold metallo-hydrolase n=1 Tax=Legionella maioricensis TaxID=2896528 RepID=A0A9X2CXN6_9GAMM|nr:MBL fold metallo-hydrolase [Legionella maioricensis]MCL9682720.1 MBL fold metallo-hydrolase [Legionella maioricensis]MCL9687232.1 MBL fold metallo-hydrolase [Legionella maioricensis]